MFIMSEHKVQLLWIWHHLASFCVPFNWILLTAMLKLPLAITLLTIMAIMTILAIPAMIIGVLNMAILGIQLKDTQKNSSVVLNSPLTFRSDIINIFVICHFHTIFTMWKLQLFWASFAKVLWPKSFDKSCSGMIIEPKSAWRFGILNKSLTSHHPYIDKHIYKHPHKRRLTLEGDIYINTHISGDLLKRLHAKLHSLVIVSQKLHCI